MEEYKLPKEIEARFLELPELIRKIILESGWEKMTRQIVENNNLRIDQGASIENEVMMVMFGFDSPDNFEDNIKRESNLSVDLAKKIREEVENNIFSLIKQSVVDNTSEEKSYFEKAKPIEEKNNDLKEEVDVPTLVEKKLIDNTISQPQDIEKEAQNKFIEPEPQIISESLSTPTEVRPIKVDPYREPIE
jgi:hypothetical protein